DNDGPTLFVSIPTSLIREGDSTTGTVTRNTTGSDNDNPLVVTLAVNNGQATVTTPVTIPAHQTSTAFTVTGVVDGVPDGNQSATVTAAATNFNPGAATVNVTDVDLPDLNVTLLSTVPATGV